MSAESGGVGFWRPSRHTSEDSIDDMREALAFQRRSMAGAAGKHAALTITAAERIRFTVRPRATSSRAPERADVLTIMSST